MKQFFIDTQSVIGQNTRFWEAAGSDLLFWQTRKPEGQALLDRMQRKKSCRYLRCHFTFSNIIKWGGQLGGGEVYSEDELGNPAYDFSIINACFKEYVSRGIKPVVEYDFIPQKICYARDGKVKEIEEGLQVIDKGPSDWNKWKELMRAFTQNLIDTFGLQEVRTWYFEVWNEPDSWPIESLQTFFRMYDVFVDAVTSVDAELRVGGPACYSIYFLRDFLQHVANGTNAVTGKKGTRIDFISYHMYGLSGGWVHEHPLVRPTVQRFIQEILWIQRLINKYPGLKGIAFHLNEWGVCSNWHRRVDEYPALAYRNSEFSPLFLVKLVHCLYAIEDAFTFPVSMLLYWGFAGEATDNILFKGMRELVTAGNLPKPIQTGHDMLSMLGEARVAVSGPKPGSNTNVIATRTGEQQIEFIVYNFNELDDDFEGSDCIEIEMNHMQAGRTVEVTGYYLDRDHHNTYRAWQMQGSPGTVEETDLEGLRRVGELTPNRKQTMLVDKGNVKFQVQMFKHSMRLYVVRYVN